MSDLVERARQRARIRREIPGRKAAETGEPDRIADLLDELAARIEALEACLSDGHRATDPAQKPLVDRALQKRWKDAEARAVRAEAKLDALVKAAEPFARIANSYEPTAMYEGDPNPITYPDDESVVLLCSGDYDPDFFNVALRGISFDEITVGDLRSARDALQQAKDAP